MGGPVLKALVLGSFWDYQGVLCAMYGRYVHTVEVMWARYEGPMWENTLFGDFSTVYSIAPSEIELEGPKRATVTEENAADEVVALHPSFSSQFLLSSSSTLSPVLSSQIFKATVEAQASQRSSPFLSLCKACGEYPGSAQHLFST